MQLALLKSMHRPLLLLAACGALSGCGNDSEGGGDFLTVTAVSPARGPLAGGNIVRVTGSGFTLGGVERNQVLIGTALADSVSVLSDTAIEVIVPSAVTDGAVGLTVFNGNGTAALENIYSYNPLPTLSAMTPDEDDVLGGETITLTGTGFSELEPGTNRVFFGDAEASDVNATSDDTITAVVPVGQVGKSAQVRVENDNGSSKSLPFRYQSRGLLAFGFQQRGGPVAPVAGNPGEVFHIDPISETMEPTEAQFLDREGDPISVCRGATIADSGIFARLQGGELGHLNFEDGATEIIGALDGCQGRLNAVTMHQGTLYGFCRDNPASDFGRIDPVAKTFTPIGTRDECCQINLVSDNTTMYLRVGGRLAPIDPLTGELGTELALTGVANSMRGLAFADGEMYFISTNLSGGPSSQTSFLYTLDPTTGDTDFVMTLGTGLRGISAAR